MATQQNVYISLIGRDDVSKTLKNVNKGMAALRGGASAVGGALLKVGAVAATASLALAGGLIAATKAAADEEKGIKSLQAAIAANVKGKTDLIGVEERVAAAQNKLAFSDGAIRDSLAALLPFTGDVASAFKVQSVAADLARAKQIDLTEASRTVAKAMNGNAKALKELGIELPKTATKAQRLAAIQKKVAGQADAYANSTEGQFARLKNSLDDTVETIGTAFLPYAVKIADWANKELLPAMQRLIPKIVDFGKKLIDGADRLRKDLQPAVENIVHWIKTELVPRLRDLAGFLKDEVIPRIGEFFGFLNDNKAVIAFVAGTILTLVIAFKAYALAVALVTAATAAWSAIQAVFNVIMAANPIGIVVIAIAALVGGLMAAYAASADFRNIVDGVFNALKPLASFVGTVLVAAFNAVTAPIRILVTVLGIVFDLIGKVVSAIANSPIGALIGGIGGFVGDLFGGAKRAGGGPVGARGAYLVGERGPELFAPNGSGRIIPNHQLAMPAFAASSGGGISAQDLRGALTGMTVVMDGNVVGSLIDNRLATSIRGARTSTRQ